MAINVDSQDLINFPGNVKRISIDQASLVPIGTEGDERYMLNFSTTAYSDNVARTRIQDYYVTSFNAGWCKSSGFAGTKFALDDTHKSIEVKIDATTSGIDSGYYRITLEHEAGVPIDSDVVAADIETKIRALDDSLTGNDIGYKLAYISASVEFKGGRFWITSGSLSEYYSGADRSSVKVRASATNDCSVLLGFNILSDSEDMASQSIKEALVTTTVSGGSTTQLTINQSIGASADDCVMIKDDTNTDYFQITSMGSDTVLNFDSSVVANNYDASQAKVQLLREQDPDAGPTLVSDDIDKITRHGVKTIIQQIDYSS